MAPSNTPETQWYENVEQGTFHEVVVGTDTERRIKSEQRNLTDDEGEEYQEAAYRKVTSKQATASPSKQPGYVKGKDSDTPASPATPEQVQGAQETPTADTNKGPLVGEPGAEAQAEREVQLGGAPPAGVKPSATAEKGK